MDHRKAEQDNYRLGCDLQLGKLLQFHTFQDRDRCTFDLNKLDLKDILDLKRIRVGKLEDFQCNRERKSILLDRWFLCIDCLVHKDWDCKGFEVVVL